MKRTGFDTMSPYAYPFYICMHPRDGFLELKANKKSSLSVVSIILALWLAVEVIRRTATGYDLNNYNPEDASLLRTAVITIIIYFMVCLSNWCFCTLLDGKGRLRDICVVVSYALVPYIIVRAITIPLSHVFTGNEGVFLNYAVIIAEIWCAFIAFSGLEEIHEYSIPKTVLAVVLTFVGLVIMLFIALMLLMLFQQVYFFIVTIIFEAKY